MIELITLCFTTLLIWVAMAQRRIINHLRKEAANRPVGRVISSEFTKEGFMVKGEIFDDKAWDKLKGDVVGLSIGYKAGGPPPSGFIPPADVAFVRKDKR